MAAGYVGSLGGAVGSAFSNTLTFTTARAVVAGEHVVVIVRSVPNVNSVSVGSLSLGQDVDLGLFSYWSAQATGAIASGSTVTVTLAAETAGGNKEAIGDVLSGIATSSYFRASAAFGTAFGTSGNVGTTDTTPQIGDVSLSTVSTATAKTFSAAGGTTIATTLSARVSGYEVLTASGATGGVDFTWTGGEDYIGAIGVYIPAAAAASLIWQPAAPSLYGR